MLFSCWRLYSQHTGRWAMTQGCRLHDTLYLWVPCVLFNCLTVYLCHPTHNMAYFIDTREDFCFNKTNYHHINLLSTFSLWAQGNWSFFGQHLAIPKSSCHKQWPQSMLIRAGLLPEELAQLSGPARCWPSHSRVGATKAPPTCVFWQSVCMDPIWNSMGTTCLYSKYLQ